MNQSSTQLIHWLLLIAGTLCVGLGIIGIFLPIVPTTPFLLLAAACYARSSQKFYTWLITNRVFGSYLKNYREGKGIPLRVKVGTLSLLWITIGFSVIFIIHILWIQFVLFFIAIAVTLHILATKTTQKQ